VPEPSVTVVVPTRNRWPLLSRALASVLVQDASLEVVVVDDGSSDETPAELARVRDRRVQVIRHASPQGVARARNAGLAAAQGTWVAFLDDDDLWAPHKLSAQLAAAGRTAAFVYAGAVVIDGDGAVKRLSTIPSPDELDRTLLGSNVVGTPSSVLARRATLERVGGFDERLAVLADWDLWLRIVAVGQAAAVFEPLIAYVEHTQNMTLSLLADIEGERRYMGRKHRAVCSRYGVRFGGPDFSRWLVGQYRAQGLRLPASREYARIGVRERSLRDVGRAAGLLFGEGVMKLGPRQRPEPTPAVDLTIPPWLEAALRDSL
jgi:glycosyltransferase involved in cell wall biosynthesis